MTRRRSALTRASAVLPCSETLEILRDFTDPVSSPRRFGVLIAPLFTGKRRAYISAQLGRNDREVGIRRVEQSKQPAQNALVAVYLDAAGGGQLFEARQAQQQLIQG